MGVVFMAAVLMCRPLLCTLSNLFGSDLAAVPIADVPYSITGQTDPVWSLLSMRLLAPQVVPASFFIKDSSDSLSLCILDMLVPGQSSVQSDSQVCGGVFLWQFSSIHV